MLPYTRFPYFLKEINLKEERVTATQPPDQPTPRAKVSTLGRSKYK